MSIRELLNPAGGLYYHWQAHKYSKKNWTPFQTQLELFLDLWNPQNDKLLIVGSSGGYTLSKKFLDRFSRIQVIDPDPLAKYFFANRFGFTPHWDGKNHLKNSNVQAFFDELQLYSEYALLFSNFIGQVPLLISEHKIQTFFAALKTFLSSRISWCSYHDLYSLPVSANKLPHLDKSSPLLEQLQVALEKGLEVYDHNTLNSFPKYDDRQWLVWPIKPHYTHIIESLFVNG